MENENRPPETFDLSEIMDELSRELKDSDSEWNQEQKSFSWNSSSTQFVSVECLDVKQPDQNVTTYKMKAVDILNVLHEINILDEKHSPYLGPNGVIEWISTNLISPIKIPTVLNWFQKHSNEHPYTFYQRYLLVSDFIAFCANQLQLDANALDANVLSNPLLFISYANEAGLNEQKVSTLRSLYRRIQPFNKIEIPHATRTTNIPLMHPLVDRYLQVLQKKGRSEATISISKMACRVFLTWLCKNYQQFTDFNSDSLPLHLVKQSHLLEYRLFMKRQASKKMIDDKNASSQFYYIRALFKTLHQLSLLQDDVASGIKGLPFDNYHYRDIPSSEEIQTFFDVTRTYSPEPHLHLLVYSLMLYLGLRISEVASLTWENFNLSTWSLSFKGKDGEYSVMPIPEPIKCLLKQFPNSAKNVPLISKPPTAFESQLYRYHVLYCLLSGWSFEKQGFHLFRHTYITKLSEHPQCTPRLLMRLARHVKSASTSVYIHRSDETLRQAAEKINYHLF